MKLLFDVGNTVVHAAYADGERVIPIANVVHRDQGMPAALQKLEFTHTPTAIWAACVASAGRRAELSDWARARLAQPVRFVASTAAACGVRNAYSEPERLGVDRWLAVIAAHRRLRAGAACVVAAGTALTVDVVTATGQHLGGLIAPGIGAQRRSLVGDTQIRARHEPEGLKWLGASTEEAVGFGTVHSALGLIERMRWALERDHAPLAMLLTGGDAAQLLPLLQSGWTPVPDLVLEGLAHLANSQ